jgi:hypothetical protein
MFLNFQNRKVLLRGLLTATVLALAAKFLSSQSVMKNSEVFYV